MVLGQAVAPGLFEAERAIPQLSWNPGSWRHSRSWPSASPKRTPAVNPDDCPKKPVSGLAERRQNGQSSSRDPQVLRHRLHPAAADGLERIIDAHPAAAEVAQRKPVARSLRAGAQAAHLAQVPVAPRVQVS